MAKEETIFFANSASPFSNWYPCKFQWQVPDGAVHTFTSAEQALMYAKANMFGDREIERKILLTNSCARIKQLGRQVKGFDADKWNRASPDIAVSLLVAKFASNAILLRTLMHTGNAVLAEASHWDKIWGIGLRASDERARNPTNWGENRLGKALMSARSRLQATQLADRDHR